MEGACGRGDVDSVRHIFIRNMRAPGWMLGLAGACRSGGI